MRKQGKVFLALCMALLLFSGCGQANHAQTPASEEAQQVEPAIQIQDMKGRDISLEKPGEKIVAITAAECEILYALGVGDRLVGRGEYCNYPEEALQVPMVQSGAQTNIEEIIALAPDVVLTSSMAQAAEQVQALENAGITVVVMEAQDIQDVYQVIDTIGIVTGRETKAQTLIEEMKARFDRVAAQAAAQKTDTPVSVYFEVSPLEYGLWAAGQDTFMDEIAQMLGLQNVFSDVNAWAEVSEEQVIERNPDYIVTSAMYFGDGPSPVEEVMGRSGWENLTAVKNQQVLHMNSDEITRPGPRLCDAAEMLYTLIYG